MWQLVSDNVRICQYDTVAENDENFIIIIIKEIIVELI